MKKKMKLTYSMMNKFRSCRKACKFRYIDEIVPKARKSDALFFGSTIHDALERLHGGENIDAVISGIGDVYDKRDIDPKQKADWNLATAMMIAYSEHYASEGFEVIALEKEFEGSITNPVTGASSRSFTFGGKVDGIVKQGGQCFLLEHKTAAQINESYLEKLWMDMQITLYAHYIEKVFKYKIAGIIYNVLTKPKLKQATGETDKEYETRLAGLIAKSKTGKSSAKRKMPETDDAFRERLLAKFKEPMAFHRETILISKEQTQEHLRELWELTKALLDARRRNVFYRNTSFCYQWNRPCSYLSLCQNGENEITLLDYEHRALHEELQDSQKKEEAIF